MAKMLDQSPKFNINITDTPLQVNKLETLFEVDPDQIGIVINNSVFDFKPLEGVKLYV